MNAMKHALFGLGVVFVMSASSGVLAPTAAMARTRSWSE